MTTNAEIIPFRGRKSAGPSLPQLGQQQDHPLPWAYGNGFIWDANRRVVGSTIEKHMAEWVVWAVNASHGHEGAENYLSDMPLTP